MKRNTPLITLLAGAALGAGRVHRRGPAALGHQWADH